MLIGITVSLQAILMIWQMLLTDLAAEEHYNKDCDWHAVERDYFWGRSDAHVDCIRHACTGTSHVYLHAT